MAISIRKWLIGKLFGDGTTTKEVSCEELFSLLEDLRIRELAFNTCVNMIANAVGKCEFKTFQNRKPVQRDEYYLWNYEPNINQNSSAFLHKLIYMLYSQNEALVISVKHRDGHEMLLVADAFTLKQDYAQRQHEYTGVTVGETTYDKTFYERDVLHFKLSNTDMKKVIDGLYDSYNKLITAAMQNYSWGSGKHLKVHVSQIQQGGETFTTDFANMINEQVKPWLDSGAGVLPEFDGYEYSNMGGNPDTQRSTRDIRALVDDIFTFTANAFGIPPVLLLGDVAGTQDAMNRWLTTCIDPLCDQLSEEITRKRYGMQKWKGGNYLRIDTTTIIHFDMFANAANVEKLIGSGAYSINDVRAAAGQDEIDETWANLHWLTLNIGTMENAARAAENGTEGGNANEANVGNQTAGR